MRPLRIGLIDMNNGVTNQAIRSFRSIIAAFVERARAVNPGLEHELKYVQPRNLGETPPGDCDLYLSSGGPDGPHEGFAESWARPYEGFLDGIVEDRLQRGVAAKGLLAVCYSFEICILHFKFAEMTPRPRKFGIMPVYPTELGQRRDLLGAFGDRFFAWEHRNWQAVNLDERKLASLGGELYARESRDGVSKGPCLCAFRFAHGIEGTIFHPEADRPGVLNWIDRPEQQQAVIEAYGELVYHRMRKTIDDPMRLARTYALLIPGWMARTFNAMADDRGWKPVPVPSYDGNLGAFESPKDA